MRAIRIPQGERFVLRSLARLIGASFVVAAVALAACSSGDRASVAARDTDGSIAEIIAEADSLSAADDYLVALSTQSVQQSGTGVTVEPASLVIADINSLEPEAWVLPDAGRSELLPLAVLGLPDGAVLLVSSLCTAATEAENEVCPDSRLVTHTAKTVGGEWTERAVPGALRPLVFLSVSHLQTSADGAAMVVESAQGPGSVKHAMRFDPQTGWADAVEVPVPATQQCFTDEALFLMVSTTGEAPLDELPEALIEIFAIDDGGVRAILPPAGVATGFGGISAVLGCSDFAAFVGSSNPSPDLDQRDAFVARHAGNGEWLRVEELAPEAASGPVRFLSTSLGLVADWDVIAPSQGAEPPSISRTLSGEAVDGTVAPAAPIDGSVRVVEHASARDILLVSSGLPEDEADPSNPHPPEVTSARLWR